MGVDSTISHAQYGIDRMKTMADPFDFYFKGTLACLKGILDYLLEEYNSKYSVGIGENEDLNADVFKKRVKDGKNPKAESFIDSYMVENKKLLADSKCEKLLGRHGSRNIAMHRKELPKNVAINFQGFGAASITKVVIKDKDGNITASKESPPVIGDRPSVPQARFFLQDWPSDDIPTLCEYTLNALKEFVKTLRTNYP
jgi:hypothetical protein